MHLSRREFIKSTAVVCAASAAGMSLPGAAQNLLTDPEFTEMKWSKAACRFCGTGCSVNVATKGG